ncbi:MAG: acylphosphatase [Actinobacteria bacterium]|nr:acylphosphatase [Actinomycetota bacterium]
MRLSGRVQGVFFRDSARQVANEHNVAGSARNLPDGRLEIVLEGPAEAVSEVVTWAETGPEFARVDAVEIVDEEPQGLRGFTID